MTTTTPEMAELMRGMMRKPVGYKATGAHYTHSTIVGITGAKRSGKSLYMSMLLFRDMLHGRTVWSNMPVRTPDALLKLGYPMLQTKVIDWDSLYMLSEDYQEGTIGLDESIYYDDSRSSLSMRNKLLNTIMNQVGHRNLNVYYTVKLQGWMDKRLLFETDIEIKCQDMAMTPWGRDLDMIRGKNINLMFYDKSGAITGRPCGDKYPEPFNAGIWTWGDYFWTAYNTKEIIGIEELYTGVKVNMKQRVISNKSGIDDEYQKSMYTLAEEFRSTGADEVPCDTFWMVLKERFGIAEDSRQLGRLLTPLNIKRKERRGGNIYDIRNLVART
jgi:hypothetical protein